MDGGAWWAAVHGVARSLTQLSDFTFNFHFPLSCIGEGNGNPLQCSRLENPRDGGAWWAAIYGVAQSRTRLKQLSCSSRLLVPWDFPGKNTGVGCHILILPNPRIEPMFLGLAGGFLTTEPPGKPCLIHAAAAAKLLQSCPTPCDPIDGSPPGSPVPGILQARTLDLVAISFSNA